MKHSNFEKRFKNLWDNHITLRRLAGVTLTSVMLLTMAGCSIGNTQSDETDNNTEISDSNSANTGNTSTNNNHSKLLNDMLNDSEVQSLMAQAKADPTIYNSAKFACHPYAFYEAQGHDVSAVKNGTLSAYTKTYVLDSEPNNLYMFTYVETAASTPYYTEYLLRYTLTDQEMDDYDFMFYNDASHFYIQAVFMNNAIAKNKKVTILSEAKMSVEAHEKLQESMKYVNATKDVLSISNANILMQSFDEENQRFNIYVYPNYMKNSYTARSKDNFGVYQLRNYREELKISNNIFLGPCVSGAYNFYETFTSNDIIPATFYRIPTSWLNSVAASELELN